MWPSPSDFDVSSNPEINSIKCQSLCQLEGDATVDGLSSFCRYSLLHLPRLHFFFFGVKVIDYLWFCRDS